MFFTLCSCKEDSYLKNADTGVTAEVDSSQENFYGFDHLIINGTAYSLITDERDNMLRAAKGAQALSPFANFGEKADRTLYEMKSSSPVKVYADSKTGGIVCRADDVQSFYGFYDDYNNYDFTLYTADDQKFDDVAFEKDVINNILALKQIAENQTSISVKSSDAYRILPTSCDKLLEREYIQLVYLDQELYLYIPAGIDGGDSNAVKIPSELQAIAEKTLRQ